MADDTTKRGKSDRSRVSKSETYEVAYFAEKHGISEKEAQEMIDRVGNDRAKLDAEAAKRDSSGDGKPAPKPRQRKPRAAAASSTAASRSRASTASKPAPRRRRTARAAEPTVAATVTDAIVEPVADLVRPAGQKVAATARRATRTSRDAVAKAPRAVRRTAENTVEGAKSAVTSKAASLFGAAAAGLVAGLAVNLGRKAVVQAPTALAGDWFEGLKTEHRMALTLFDQLQATEDSDTGKRSTLLTQLKHALGKHAFTEENVIYPALRTFGDSTDADKLNHEHGYVKQYLYDLEQMDNASPAFLEKVAEFRRDIESHIDEEETRIFPPMHAALGEEGNAKVTALANKEGFKLA